MDVQGDHSWSVEKNQDSRSRSSEQNNNSFRVNTFHRRAHSVDALTRNVIDTDTSVDSLPYQYIESTQGLKGRAVGLIEEKIPAELTGLDAQFSELGMYCDLL